MGRRSRGNGYAGAGRAAGLWVGGGDVGVVLARAGRRAIKRGGLTGWGWYEL